MSITPGVAGGQRHPYFCSPDRGVTKPDEFRPVGAYGCERRASPPVDTGGYRHFAPLGHSQSTDSEVKKQLDDFCTQVGMNTTTAFNMFARAVLREKRLPFDVTTESDPFYSESNLAHLCRSIAALNSGKGIEHDIVEVSE